MARAVSMADRCCSEYWLTKYCSMSVLTGKKMISATELERPSAA
jgi:hypothetical protein